MSYKYIYSWGKFIEKLFQSKEYSFGGLSNKGITDQYYRHSQIWNKLNMDNFCEYPDLCIIKVALLFSDAFEDFWKNYSLKIWSWFCKFWYCSITFMFVLFEENKNRTWIVNWFWYVTCICKWN